MQLFQAVTGTTYHIQISGYNGDGTQRTGSILLTYTFAGSGPLNDNFVNAQTISGSLGSVPGTTVAATREFGEPPTVAGGGHSVWFRWVAPSNGNWSFTTDGSGYDTTLGFYTGASVNALTTIVSNDDNDDSLTSTHSTVMFNAATTTEYFIAVDGYDAYFGSVVLNWAPTPLNDNFTQAQSISGETGGVTGNNLGATLESGENQPSPGPVRSVWYNWTTPSSGTWTFNTQGSDFDSVLAIYVGTIVTNLTPVASNDNVSSSNSTSSVTFNATAGTIYRVAVYGNHFRGIGGADTSAGNIVLNWFPFAPVLSGVGLAGGNLMFSFRTTAQTNYVIEFKNSLNETNWQWFTNFTGDGLPRTVIVPVTARPQQFFRVRVP